MPPLSSKSCVETIRPKDWDTEKTESSTSVKISERFIIFFVSNHGQYNIRSSPILEERATVCRTPDRVSG